MNVQLEGKCPSRGRKKNLSDGVQSRCTLRPLALVMGHQMLEAASRVWEN